MKESPTNEEFFDLEGAIVVGVDGSESSRDALAWAAAQARLTSRRLVAITTWEWPASYGVYVGIPIDVNFEEDATQALHQAIEKTLDEHDAAMVIEKVIHGHPAPVLLDASKHATLLVIGSRGHGEFTGMLLGSVSEYLATHAQCPVVIVRHPATHT
jgi:nucleotide-binding universal stress UspA family protein